MKRYAVVAMFTMLGCVAPEQEIQSAQAMVSEKPSPQCADGGTCLMNDGTEGVCTLGVCALPCSDASDCPYGGDCRDASCLLGGCMYFGAPTGRACDLGTSTIGQCHAGACE